VKPINAERFFIDLGLIAAVLLPLVGCVARETQKSRDLLNCVYHEQYELGLTRANAEAKCK